MRSFLLFFNTLLIVFVCFSCCFSFSLFLLLFSINDINNNNNNHRSTNKRATENRLICDCRLRWIFDLRRKTKNEDLRQSLQRIECFYEGGIHGNADLLGHAHGLGGGGVAAAGGAADGSGTNNNLLQDPTLFQRPNGPNDNGEYIDETGYENQLSNNDNVVQLLRFNEEQLPCSQRLTDPTELPLSRESIGMDLSWRSDVTSTAHNSKVSLVSCLTLVLSSTLVIYSIVTVFH